MNDHDRASIDVVSYLLGELDPADEERARRAERDDPAFRAEVERLRPTVGALRGLPDAAWNPEDPPPLRLPESGSPVVSLPVRTRRGFSFRPAIAAAIALVLVGVGAVIGAVLWDGGDDSEPPGRTVALGPVEGAPEAGSASVLVPSNTGDEARLMVDDLRPSGSEDFYELWLLNSVDDLVSLGSFKVPADGRTSVAVPLPFDVDRYQYFDVSLEPDDGNPGHSSVSVLRGSTS
jgi:anti-sigma-K factor RskA